MSYKIFTTIDSTVMGRKTDGLAVTGAATYYSTPWDGEMASTFGLTLKWTGTPTGTFTIWATPLLNPVLTDDTDWEEDTTFSPTNPAGTAGKFRDNGDGAAAKFWRVKYVNASGTGVVYGYATPADLR